MECDHAVALIDDAKCGMWTSNLSACIVDIVG